VGTRYQGITRAVYGSEACCKTAGLTAFSNTDLNRTLYLVKFSEKIPGRFVENQHLLQAWKSCSLKTVLHLSGLVSLSRSVVFR